MTSRIRCDWQRNTNTFVGRQYTSTRKTSILNPICELGERGSTVLKTRASHMDTSGIFHRVMQDVLARSKKEFAAEHLSENVLNKLATLWEEKLLGGVKLDIGVKPESEENAGGEKNKRARETAGSSSNKITKFTHEATPTRSPTITKSTDNELSSDSDELAELREIDSANILLGQFEKVSRTKSKWKCFLKDGIVTVNGRDLVFSRAAGEFVWT